MVSSAVASTNKALTFAEYLVYREDSDPLYELYRGHLIPMPTPTGIHIKICDFLVYEFRRYFARENPTLVATTTAGVRTEEDSSRIPDLIVCSETLWDAVCDRGGSAVLDFEEKPQLLVEVTSGNWRDDYIRKRAEYDLIEHWIVDPNKSRIWICSRSENESAYGQQEFLPGQEVRSVQFPQLVLPVSQVLSPPLVEKLLQEEEQQRQQLEQRAELLAQRLQELGVDPNSI